MVTGFTHLNATNAKIDGLMADFSGLNNLEQIVDKVLNRMALKENVQQQVRMAKGGNLSMAEFDGWFSQLVRAELGKTLAIVRAKAVQKASTEGKAGSASTAVKRRMYKDDYIGNINIAKNRNRISSRKRVVPPPTGGKSGIRRARTVQKRTQQLREYYGPDRDFILRILEGGRDVYYAKPEGPTGPRSMATYGKRGSMTPRGFWHNMKQDMELAAQQLGQTLTGQVEKWIEQQFNEG